MTVAVCLRCGGFKVGAFSRCAGCGHAPQDEADLTRHLPATDHDQDRETLNAIAARVQAGEPIAFDPAVLRQVWVSRAALETADKRVRMGCALVVFGGRAIAAVSIWHVARSRRAKPTRASAPRRFRDRRRRPDEYSPHPPLAALTGRC